MDALKALLENVQNHISENPALQGGLAVGGTVLGLVALTLSWFRKGKKPQRSTFSFNVPEGTKLSLNIGGEDKPVIKEEKK